jgi:hypothetical protein
MLSLSHKSRTSTPKPQYSDPLNTFFQKIFRGNALLAAAVCAAIHISLWIGVSLAVKARYPGFEASYFNDKDELSFGLFLWGVFVPILWGYYIASDHQWREMVRTLVDEKVVDQDFSGILVKPAYPLLALTIAIGVGLFYRFVSIPSEIGHGRLSFWFVNEWLMFLISFLVAFNANIFISFVLRTINLSYRLRIYFDKFGVQKVHIFSADECGGFGVVGSLAMRFSSLAVLVGVWATWYCLLPVFAGGDPNFEITVILIYIAYAILVPLLLYLIARPVHNAMLQYKHRYKSDVACRLEELFASIDRLDLVRAACEGDTARYLDDYNRLKMVYERIDTIPEWPISLKNFRKFSGFASLPGIIGFVTFVLDMVNIFSRKN